MKLEPHSKTPDRSLCLEENPNCKSGRLFSFRPFVAVCAGALAGLLVAAVPLWRQHIRYNEPRAVRPVRAVPSFLDAWQSAQSNGGKTGAVLRTAALAESLTDDECRAAADSAVTTGRHEPLRDLLRRWASLDGPAAFAWLDEHPGIRPKIVMDPDFAWAAVDPDGYCAWMLRHIAAQSPEEAARDTTIIEAVIALLQFDVPAAIRIAGAMGPSAKRNGGPLLDRNLLRPAIRTNADALAAAAEILAHREWLAAVPGEKHLPVLVSLRECWQEIDPEAWDRWAAAHPGFAAKSDPQPQHPGIAFLRSADRAAGALQIMENAPVEKLQETSDGLLRLWTGDDMAAAGEWVNTLPDGPLKSAAAQSYALLSAADDPQAALRWAGTLTDSEVRARTQRRVFKKWLAADPAAARDWLPASGWDGVQMQQARDIMAAAPEAR